MIRAGIAGATGYTGLELVRLLDRHPNTEVVWLTSENSAGRLYSDVVHGPWPIELIPLADALGRTDEVDAVFLALPHAQSVQPVVNTSPRPRRNAPMTARPAAKRSRFSGVSAPPSRSATQFSSPM